MLKRIFLGLFAAAMILVIVYMLGPKVSTEELTIEYPAVPTRLNELSKYVANREDSVKGLKEENEAYIIWADSANKSKTPYSIVYIHGFSASPMEGDPVHRFLAEHFGANLFVTRLPEHGINRENGMEFLTAKALANAAGEAYQIGKSLGDEVIIVGTSMGGALSILLASQQPDIKALVLYSPAIRDNGQRLQAFFSPWSKKLMETTMMDNKVLYQKRQGEKLAYWSDQIHSNGYESLAVLMYSEMNKPTFQKVTQPLFLGYFFKNEEEQDFVVSVPKMLEMFDQVSTPTSMKFKKAFPKAGDHVIASSVTSKDWEGVMFSTIDFLENMVGIPSKAEYQDRVNTIIQAENSLAAAKK
jgi:pimeloyl-ACP methyl ester carboxylesterase